MATWTPDPTFYPSPRLAARAPPEKLAYVASFDPKRQRNDEIAVVDLDSKSLTYGQIVRRVEMPGAGDELHHFGWNACSSCLCPNMPHPHVERRYLIVPGIRSSRIHILDTKPDPRNPEIVKVVQPGEIADRTGYSRPHTVHCGPDGIYISALGNAEGKAPAGILLMDHETFEVLGRWEVDRGSQEFAYDMWWHLGHDTVVTSEWGTPDMFENGLVSELLLGGKYGHKLHFWDLHRRKHLQEIDLGTQHQLIFELRPAHDPTKAYGFVNCVLSLENLSSSIWTWYRDGDRWKVRKVIEIPAEPADPDLLPPAIKDFKTCPPFVTDIDLSVDDKYLYVSCWGTGDFHQYDVSDPFDPKLLVWSFLMASAHGAGLMLVPAVFPLCFSGGEVSGVTVAHAIITPLAAVGVHTAVMVTVSGTIAILVYDWIGLGFLRRGWINFDWLWTAALGVTGMIVLALTPS